MEKIKNKLSWEKIEAIEFETLDLERHTLYKYELAQLYNVDIKTMVAWMELFMPKLERLGYHKHMKKLPPKIVRCIIDHLGEP